MSARPQDLAVVGMACRFPGAPDLAAYWRLLCSGEDALREAPADRWDAAAFYDPDPAAPGKMSCRSGGFVDGMDLLDADFFAISPREAVQLDPRQRWILEVGWEALEDAGIAADRLAGSATGVFVSVLAGEFTHEAFARQPALLDAYSGAGGTDSVIANRLSYVLDLKGPSLTVDTACSGSLVALHLAAQSLQSGECELALVGGVNLVLEPTTNVFFSKAGILSTDGRCHPFDHRADGTVRSDGAGLVVVKTLAAAEAAGDRIYAVVRGSAINHNGRGNGLMAPSSKQQALLLREACRRAGTAPSEIQYVEAHGTGTSLGDPIEVEALLEAYGEGRGESEICAFASVKSVIGHLEAAAGIAGLIKVALAMHHRQLPGMAGFERINPLISLEGKPWRLQSELGSWPQPERRLLAGVSSFGLGGANAHVVLEEAAPAVRLAAGEIAADDEGIHLLALSARSAAALRETARRYCELLADPSRGALGDVCRAALRRRAQHRHRLALAGDRAGLLGRLDAFLAEGGERMAVRSRPRLAFVFSGQGCHWTGMGLALARRFPVYDRSLRGADAAYRQLSGGSLLELLADGGALESTAAVQPAIVAVQIALVDLLRSIGIVPDAVAGQSLGEVAAAYAAGALDAAGAMAVAFHRARLMARTAGSGATAWVALPAAELEPWLATSGGRLAVAGRSTPRSCVISGDLAGIDAALASLAARGVTARRIADGGVAFHSPAMDDLLGELHAALAELRPAAGGVPFYSSIAPASGNGHGVASGLASGISGGLGKGPAAGSARTAGAALGADYWCRNLREPFGLPRLVEELCRAGALSFAEIGPHPVLTRSLQENLEALGSSAAVFTSLSRQPGDESPLLALLAALFEQGHSIDGLYETAGRWVDLPTYPWQRSRFWMDRTAPPYAGAAAGGAAAAGSHPLLGARRDVAGGAVVAIWDRRLAADSLHYLDEHRFLGTPVLPGAAVLEMMAAAARELLHGPCELFSAEFHRLLPLEAAPGREVQLVASRGGRGLSLALWSRPLQDTGAARAFTLHATGSAVPAGETAAVAPLDLAAIRARCPRRRGGAEHYSRMSALGLGYGPAFQVVEAIDGGDGELLAKLRLPAALAAEAAAYDFHPALLDGVLQTLAALETGDEHRYLPAGVGALRRSLPVPAELYCHALLGGEAAAGHLRAELTLADAEGRVVARLEGVDLQRLDRAAGAGGGAGAAGWLYEVAWQAVVPAAAIGAAETWILLADRGGVAAALAGELRRAGQRPLLVHRGDVFRAAADGAAGEARPGHAEDLARHLGATYGARPCSRIVDGWALDLPPFAELDGAALDLAFAEGAGRLLELFRAAAAAAERPRISVLTRGAQKAGPDAEISPLQAALWGFARAIGHGEHRELWGGLVDLEAAAAPGPEAPQLMAASLLAALLDPAEDLLALRGGTALAPRLVRHGAVLPGDTAGDSAGNTVGNTAGETALRPDATYLLSGGFGGLGQTAADWLVERGARHLLLVGRSPLPPRESWRGLLPGDPAAERVAAVRRLEARGVAVHAAALDVADEAALAELLARWEAEERPPIRGLVHLAGVVRDRLAATLEPSDLAAVWGPKARGAFLLDRLLGDRLELCVFFSSVAAVVSRPGQSAYAGANAFLDGLAQGRRRRGLPALSIGWGPWAEVGMAARQGLTASLAAAGLEPLLPREGLELLRLMGRGDAAHLVALRADWPRALGHLASGGAPPLIAGLAAVAAPAAGASATGASAAASPAGLAAVAPEPADPAGRRAWLGGLLVGRAAQVLRLDPLQLAADRPLTELGIDSIVVMELKGWVDQRFKVSIPIEDWLRGSSLEGIAALIDEELAAAGEPPPWTVPGPERAGEEKEGRQ